MAPSEGEDGVGWPGLCSLDRGASRRPMIGNQIAAHPSPPPSSSSLPSSASAILFHHQPEEPPGHRLSTLTLSPRNPIHGLLPATIPLSLHPRFSLYSSLSPTLSLSLFSRISSTNLFLPLYRHALPFRHLSLSLSLFTPHKLTSPSSRAIFASTSNLHTTSSSSPSRDANVELSP